MDSKSGHVQEYVNLFDKLKKETEFIEDLTEKLNSGNKAQKSQARQEFYSKFFKIKSMEELRSICEDYLKGIQFVMYYYFRGCPSWTWYYPYFMSPMLSDLILTLDIVLRENPDLDFTFELGEPFQPYEQLLFILPKASMDLMPKMFGDLITKPDSKIKHFFPDTYEFDPFDSIKEYAWIPDIEVIDKQLMDEEFKTLDLSALSEKEKFRNLRGSDILYRYDPKVDPVVCKSKLGGITDVNFRIRIENIDIRGVYPFDFTKIVREVSGVEESEFPSFFYAKKVSAYIYKVNRRARYDKCIIKVEAEREFEI